LCCAYYTGESSFEVQTKADSSKHAEHPHDDKQSIALDEWKHDGNAVLHRSFHNKKKMYQCYVCNKEFSHSGYLKYHIRIHTGEKPYNCSLCNRNFARTTQLKAHKCRAQLSATSEMKRVSGVWCAQDKEENLAVMKQQPDDVCYVWYFVVHSCYHYRMHMYRCTICHCLAVLVFKTISVIFNFYSG